jgi:hypothetical protein
MTVFFILLNLEMWFPALKLLGHWCSLWSEDPGFVLQMEKSKQSMWMGWRKTAFLRKGESPILPGEEREGEGGMVGTGGVHWPLLFFFRCL